MEALFMSLFIAPAAIAVLFYLVNTIAKYIYTYIENNEPPKFL